MEVFLDQTTQLVNVMKFLIFLGLPSRSDPRTCCIESDPDQRFYCLYFSVSLCEHRRDFKRSSVPTGYVTNKMTLDM